MEEQELVIEPNGEYKNITIKTRYKWSSQTKQFEFDSEGNKIVTKQGLKPDHYIDVVKGDFSAGREVPGQYGVNYSCTVVYKGEKVSFWLNNEWVAKAFEEAGEGGTPIRISCVLENKLNKKLGVKVPVEVLKFEAIN